jgi:quinone-modifying oxidoreductase, subunit QmoC
MAQALQVDPTLMKRLRKFGAFDVSACFNCGNCTAICPLSSETTAFPRRMITYAQQGLEGRLLESPDMWLCDYCAECSKTCPRQAEPSEFMMAVRRFAVSKYTPTPVSRMLFTSKAFVALFMAVVALVPLGMFATLQDPAGQGFNLFSMIPEEWIHYSGIAVGVAIGAFILAGVVRMYLRVSPGLRGGSRRGPGAVAWLRALIPTVVNDSLMQSRSEKCEAKPTLKESLKGRWFSHMMMFWGFLGLLLSTGLRFLVAPTSGEVVPIADPVRLLGTVSGAALAYGALALMVGRARRSEESMKHTLFADWVFLGLLFLAGVTGFVLEGFDYTGVASYTNWALLAHLVVVFELLVIAPFTKFAHVVYRPFAIWMSRAYHHI